ncbi:hypothetical protein OJF2_18780 [Aquisphaera giovannonii]|uniref:HEPN domain-containing protein n=2 Tax=Aquisphaera giovannonii TaxID=406548 RepID=A0A5B9VZI8_9BACT|nr:hypothetical protein OJF2_18780 [Aquisphaera giovannonii]
MSDTRLMDLEAAWREREIEAAKLVADHPSTGLALRIYALEIRLKTLICKTLAIPFLPRQCKTHAIDELIVFTGFSSELDDPANAGIRQNWELLVDFARNRLNGIRYLPAGALDGDDLALYLSALDDPKDGVWTWLSRHP